MTRVYFDAIKGRYNMLSNEESWVVRLYTPWGEVTESFRDEPPLISRWLPSQVLNLIEERLEEYSFHSGREGQRAKIKTIRDKSAEMDALYLKGKIKAKAEELRELKHKLKVLESK